MDSYMWAGSEVGDGARIEGAIVASRAMAKTPAGEKRGWRGDSGCDVEGMLGCFLACFGHVI